MNRCSVLYKSSLLGLLRRRVTKQSEVCHWIVSVNSEISTGRNLQVILNSPINPGMWQPIDSTGLLPAKPLNGKALISVARARTR